MARRTSGTPRGSMMLIAVLVRASCWRAPVFRMIGTSDHHAQQPGKFVCDFRSRNHLAVADTVFYLAKVDSEGGCLVGAKQFHSREVKWPGHGLSLTRKRERR